MHYKVIGIVLIVVVLIAMHWPSILNIYDRNLINLYIH